MQKQALKIIGVVTILIMILFTLTGCDNRKELVLKDQKTGYTVTFKYPENETYNVTSEDSEGKQFVEMTVENKDKNIEIDMYFFEESQEAYNASKTGEAKYEGYKEYKWNEYDGYIYAVYEDSLYFCANLQVENGEVTGLFGEVSLINSEGNNILDVFNSQDFQDFMNSMEFTISK